MKNPSLSKVTRVFAELAQLSVVASLGLLLTANAARAATVTVGAFGDQGWKSDDTRNTSGTDLVGINNTHAGDVAVTPSAADDAAIATQIKFVGGPAGSTHGGAVSIDGTATVDGKSNYSVISPTTGFDDASNLLTTFSATWEWYKQHTSAGSTLAFKLGIQSTDWGTGTGQSQETFTATRSGESVWDLVLVHVPTPVTNNVWRTDTVDHDSGTWILFDQAGNPFFTPPGNILGGDKTLDGWNADATWGPKLFGAGAKVSSIQFGLGSSQPVAIGFVDYLQTNLLNGGDVINFVPEPSTAMLAVLGAAALCLAAVRKRIRCR